MSKNLEEELDKIFVEDYTNGLCLPLDDDAKIAIKRLITQEQVKAEHHWIKYYGDQRKFLDGSDGDIPAIQELNRHQQLHKDKLAELEKELESE